MLPHHHILGNLLLLPRPNSRWCMITLTKYIISICNNNISYVWCYIWLLYIIESLYTYIHTTYIHTYIHIHKYTYVHTYICMYVCMYVFMYVCMYMYMYGFLRNVNINWSDFLVKFQCSCSAESTFCDCNYLPSYWWSFSDIGCCAHNLVCPLWNMALSPLYYSGHHLFYNGNIIINNLCDE